MRKFRLVSKLRPRGDQPQAIEKLTENLKTGIKNQVLLGVTGSGKTFTMASVIEKVQKPVLIISPNKTLAAQLYQEFKEFFPENAVHYFVSYYDYYQPEAYIPQTDTYIEKDAKINDLIDQLRHAATADVLSRSDVIVIASVSCIYGIGDPEEYQNVSLELKSGQKVKRQEFLKHLVLLQYQRNDYGPIRGEFRVRGDQVEIWLPHGTEKIRVDLEGNKVKSLERIPLDFKVNDPRASYFPLLKFKIFPAKHFVTPPAKLALALHNIEIELEECLKNFKVKGGLLEAERLEQRTRHDLEMLAETGYCHGIENYSRHLSFRKPGEPSYALLDYYLYPPKFFDEKLGRARDFLVFLDESHLTIPQLRAMAQQDRVRKETLVEYGFRLPSAIDNRPLTFEEFQKKVKQIIYVSATPDKYEINKALQQAQGKAGKKYVVEQLIRPTGLLEPSLEIRSTKNQVKDLIEEMKKQVSKKQRTLVLTLTKRLAEDLSDYLAEEGIKTTWLHSEVKTLERPQILKDLREGKYDVLVGINLLREGLDLPEVALVAILDADKEGFLRSETTLIQTMGRAARHLEGRVILYADEITGSIKRAMAEIKRRRKIQMEYNKKYKIKPKPIIKEIRDWPFVQRKKEITAEFWLIKDLKLLEKEMKTAAKNLDFERAAEIRDLIKGLKSSKVE